jgi:hypothetical protein
MMISAFLNRNFRTGFIPLLIILKISIKIADIKDIIRLQSHKDTKNTKHNRESKIMSSPNYQSTEYRSITIKTTDGSTIHGKVNLAYKQRVSDLFTKCTTPFLIMVEVMSKDSKGKVMFINKEHIVWAEPEEE